MWRVHCYTPWWCVRQSQQDLRAVTGVVPSPIGTPLTVKSREEWEYRWVIDAKLSAAGTHMGSNAVLCRVKAAQCSHAMRTSHWRWA